MQFKYCYLLMFKKINYLNNYLVRYSLSPIAVMQPKIIIKSELILVNLIQLIYLQLI